MLFIPPPLQRILRRRIVRGGAATPTPPPPPPVPPVLIEASFDAGTLVLTLGFDRAVDLEALDPSQIGVDDGPGTGLAYVGSGAATVLTPERFTLGMSDAGSSGGMAIVLLASASCGIVAADDGGVWAGTGSGVVLPYPMPVPPALITSVGGSEGDLGIAINFDREIVLAEGAVPDDALLFGGLALSSVWQQGPATLGAYMQVPAVLFSTPWQAVRQPDWVLTEMAVPVEGVVGPP